jgi:hypothetical protein
MDQKEILFVVLGVLGMYMVHIHNQPDYHGPYEPPAPTDNPIFEDTIKIGFLKLVIYMLYKPVKPLYNQNQILESFVGEVLVILLSMILYHHIIDPYLIRDWGKRLFECNTKNNKETFDSDQDQDQGQDIIINEEDLEDLENISYK